MQRLTTVHAVTQCKPTPVFSAWIESLAYVLRSLAAAGRGSGSVRGGARLATRQPRPTVAALLRRATAEGARHSSGNQQVRAAIFLPSLFLLIVIQTHRDDIEFSFPILTRSRFASSACQ